MRHRSDLLLVRRARDGDEKACEALVQKYYPEIYRYCLMHLSDAYEAEDLTQEVFTSFCTAVPVPGIWKDKRITCIPLPETGSKNY